MTKKKRNIKRKFATNDNGACKFKIHVKIWIVHDILRFLPDFITEKGDCKIEMAIKKFLKFSAFSYLCRRCGLPYLLFW